MGLDQRALAPSSITKREPRPLLGGPRLSVVIVNYRQWDETAALVRQLAENATLREGGAEIVIVDNHSIPHPVLANLRRMPNVSIRRWKSNHGFAKAVNEGCRLGQGDWFLLLNPDMSLSNSFLDRVVETLNPLETTEPRVGIVGFHLRNADGTQQHSTGPIPSLTATLARLFLPRPQRKYHVLPAADSAEVPWVTGCCLLLRRECLEDVGGLDEKFFLYYEDVDLCLRAKQNEWQVRYDPTLAVVHHHPLHGRHQPAALRLVTRHSLLTFADKHWPRWQSRLLARLIRVEGRLRRGWSKLRRDSREAEVFNQLAALAGDFLAADHEEARRRLDRVIRRLDLRIGI